jgi:hypothetical protein
MSDSDAELNGSPGSDIVTEPEYASIVRPDVELTAVTREIAAHEGYGMTFSDVAVRRGSGRVTNLRSQGGDLQGE